MVCNLELSYLIMSLAEAAFKKMSEYEVMTLTLDYQAKFSLTLANIADLKSDFGRLELILSNDKSGTPMLG